MCRLSRLPCLLVVSLSAFVSACGGGGGSAPAPSGGSSGGGSGGGGSGGGGSGGGTGPALVSISDGNVLDLASLVLNDAEILQINAELITGGAALTQLVDGGYVDIGCWVADGSIHVELQDIDANGDLSPGDRVALVVENCDGFSGQMTLQVDTLSQSGIVFDDLSGTVSMQLTISDPDGAYELESTQAISFTAGPNLIRWRSVNGRVWDSDSQLVTREASVEKLLVPTVDFYGYVVSMSGVSDIGAESLEFDTPEAFRGAAGAYPNQGTLQLDGDASGAQVAGGAPAESGRYRVDSSGTGQYGPDVLFAWADLGLGPLFEVRSQQTDSLPPGVSDLRTRSHSLGGSVADAVVDSARNRIYFSITDRNEVAAVDLDTLLVVERIYVGSGPRGLWLSDDGARLYAALSQSGAIGILDLETRNLESVVVAAEVGSSRVHDVVEASPGIVFATAEGDAAGEFVDPIYIVRIDLNQGKAVTRVANGRDIGTGSPPAVLLVSPDKAAVYVGSGVGLFRLDATDALAPVTLESTGGGVGSYTFALSADGQRIHSGNGVVFDAGTFDVLGETDRGYPYPLADGSAIAQIGTGRLLASAPAAVDQYEFDFEFYSGASFGLQDRFRIVCELGEPLHGLLPLPGGGEWLFYGPAGICATDLFDPVNPPGSDGSNPPPDTVEIISSNASVISLPQHPEDMLYDTLRGLLYFSNWPDNEVLAYSADTLELVRTYAVSGGPTLMDMGPSGNELAIVPQYDNSIGFLDLDSGVFETLQPAGTLDVSLISDAAYVAADAIYAIAWLGSGAQKPDVIRISRSNSPEPFQVAAGIDGVLVQLYEAGSRLFVHSNTPNRLFALDLTLPGAPIVASTDLGSSGGLFSFAVNPDGSSIAMRSGEVFRAADLTQLGAIEPGGALAYSDDGTLIGWSSRVGEIHFFDAVTFRKTLIVETGCGDSGTEELVPIAALNAWVARAGLDVCVAPLPSSTLQAKPQMKPVTRYAPGDYCDSDCMVRRYVAPTVMNPGIYAERRIEQ